VVVRIYPALALEHRPERHDRESLGTVIGIEDIEPERRPAKQELRENSALEITFAVTVLRRMIHGVFPPHTRLRNLRRLVRDGPGIGQHFNAHGRLPLFPLRGRSRSDPIILYYSEPGVP
jgi:hypothetical protein